jgi:hypothetical protein
MKKIFITLSLAILTTTTLIGAVSTQAQAQDTNTQTESSTILPPLPKPDLLPGPQDENNTNNPDDIRTYFSDRLLPMAAQRLVTIIALLSIVSLIFAGFKYYTAFGDEGKAEEGKKIAQYAILGLVLSLMSLAIVSIIGGLAQFFQ